MEEQLMIEQLEDSMLPFDFKVVQTVGYISHELREFQDHLNAHVLTTRAKLEAYVKKNKNKLTFDADGLVVEWSWRASPAVKTQELARKLAYQSFR